jgi:hypothetical protein
MDGEDPIFRERAVDSALSPESINRVAPIVSERLWVLLAGALVANPVLEAQQVDAENAAARLREQDANMTVAEDVASAAFTKSMNVRDTECRRSIGRTPAVT